MLACTYPSFDGPMILFQDVIEVLHRSVLAVLLQNPLVFEVHDGWRITGVLVGIDYARRRMICSDERFGEEALVRRCIAFGREQEVDRRTAGQAELARILLSQLQKSPVSRLRTTWTKAAPSRRTARSDRRRHEGPKSACRKDGGQRRHFSRTRRGFYRKFPWGWLSRDGIVV